MRLQTSLLIALLVISKIAFAQEKTDRHYPVHHFDYSSIQVEIDELSKDPKIDTYGLAKAQAWLNSSKYEMWRNDSGWWPQAAFDEAKLTIAAIKNKDTSVLGKTNALKVNHLIADELWQETISLKKKNKACSRSLIARAEVELVHAAYEVETTSWKDATPQLGIVRELLARSKSCN